MNKNLLKWFFGTFALIAAAAFTGCSNDDDSENLVPQMSADPTSLTFENVEGEASKEVVITANCTWKVKKSNLDWATVTPESGTGSGIITVKVKEIEDGTKSRTGSITFDLITGIGNWGDNGSPKIAVTQTDGDNPGPGPGPVGDVIWSETCGNADASAKPLVGDYTGWDTTGSGASTVTYTGVNTSVRASGLVNNGSGHNEIFFGKVPASFTANSITLTAEQTNLQLTFLGSRSVKTDDGYDNTFDPSKLTVALSKDGQSWTDITYTVTGGEEHPYWATCTADFTLKEAVSSLYIRFTASEASVIRIDDMKLATGNGGTVVDLGSGGDKPNPGGEATIAEVIAGTVGNTYTTKGQVVAINGRSFLIQDNTGRMLVYLGWDKEASAPVVSYDATIGQTVKVTGSTTTYSKLVQFSEVGLQIEKVSDGTFTQPTPKTFTGADFDAYKALATPTVEYIQYTGTLTISGFYYNVAVEGTTLQGSLAYPAEGFVDAALDGQAVTVTGYTLGMTNSASMLSTIATSVVAAGEVPTEPAITKVDPTKLTFAAEGQTLSVNVTTANADGCTLSATTDNAAQFTATVSGLTSVSVTAKENATDAAINATLTISLMKGGAAVATKTVALTQNKKSENPGGDAVTITMTYTDIINGGTDIPTNSYGDQNVEDPATYYNWSFSSIDFAGAKVCIANATDYAGLIQMQGNATDAKKQGFFGNVTDLGKITKIVIVSKNTKYEPTEHLYMGGEAYPKGNVQTRTSMTQDGQLYTETYDIAGDYGFFSIANDKQGAFYVQSVEITYVK